MTNEAIYEAIKENYDSFAFVLITVCVDGGHDDFIGKAGLTAKAASNS